MTHLHDNDGSFLEANGTKAELGRDAAPAIVLISLERICLCRLGAARRHVSIAAHCGRARRAAARAGAGGGGGGGGGGRHRLRAASLFALSFACAVTDWSTPDHVTGRAPNHARDNEIAYVNVCPQCEHKTNADVVAIWVVLFMREAQVEMSSARLSAAGLRTGPPSDS